MIRRLLFGGWLATIATAVSLSATSARAQSSVDEAQLETFLGLTPPSGLNSGALTGLGNGPVTDGSAILQTVVVGAGGATLTFQADFLTNSPPPGANPLAALDPFAFYTQPTLTDFADNFTNYSGSSLTGLIAAPSQTGFAYQTGYTSYSVSLSQGTYNLGFGIADVTGNQYPSALLISDLSLSAGSLKNGSFGSGDFSGWSTIGNTSVVTSDFGITPPVGPDQALISTASVPEPSTFVLMIVGGLGAALAIRRHCQSRA